MLDAIIDKLKLRKLKRYKGAGYAAYLDQQYIRSKNKTKHKKIAKEEKRREYLVQLLASTVNLDAFNNALVLGCRDSDELDLLEKHGVGETVGVDLFSNDSRILVMDMHQLGFEDDSFGLVYCSHTLEHALDYGKVMSEIARVITSGGYLVIEVPANFIVRGVEINDFKNCTNLLQQLTEFMKVREIVCAEDIPKGSDNNYCGSDAIRLIVRID